MDSDNISFVGKMASNVFNSNYPSECLFLVIVIILLILIIVCICTRHGSDPWSFVASRSRQSLSIPRSYWPDIHQISASANPPTLPVAYSQRKAVVIPAAISAPAQPQNAVNGRETDSLLRNVFQYSLNVVNDYQDQQTSDGCGLENFGHSCYINSALQCLYHIRSFVEVIVNLRQEQPNQLPPITAAYSRLLTEMQSTPRGSISAEEVKVRMGELNQRFAGTNEQDSHEFLIVLLEALHDELMDNYQNSSISDLIHGTIRSTVKCHECEVEINTDDSFLSLPLPIHRSTDENVEFEPVQYILGKALSIFGYNVQNDNTLYHCFQNLLMSEELGANGMWFCQNCEKTTNASKKLDLHQLPKVLILQLKRFTDDLTNDTKIATQIQFEEVLDLRQFLMLNHTDQSVKYDLVAVVAHTGTLASGHYTTFARHLSNGCWHHFNDRHVRQVSLSEVLISDAYVLLYERLH